MPRSIYISLLVLSSVSLAAFASLLYQNPPHEALRVASVTPTTTSPTKTGATITPPRVTLPARDAPRALVSEAPPSRPTPVDNTPRAVATIEIEGLADTRTYDIARAGDTLIDAMKSLADQGLAFTMREYSGMGAFVESIDGTKNADGYYWILWVNGTKAAAGASSIIVHEGDHFRWTYEQGY